MTFMIVRHKVQDYRRWKVVFDETEDLRRSAGIGGGHITRNLSALEELYVMLQCEDVGRARRFIESDEVRRAMQRAGVIDRPDVRFLDAVERVHEPVSAAPAAGPAGCGLCY